MDFGDFVGIAATILAALAIMGTGLVWIIRGVVREELKKYTMPIQPGFRNGGDSLADIAAQVKLIIKHIGIED